MASYRPVSAVLAAVNRYSYKTSAYAYAARGAYYRSGAMTMAARASTTVATSQFDASGIAEDALRESFRRYRTENYGSLCSVREVKREIVRAVDPEGTQYVQEAHLRKVLANIDANLNEADINAVIKQNTVEGKGIPMQSFERLLC